MKAVVLDMPPHWLEDRRRKGNDRFDEVWAGVLHMVPPPGYSHQDLERALLIWLHAHWERPRGGRSLPQIALTPPDNLADWTHNYRVPDLVLLTPDRFHIMHEPCFAGGPTAVIEIRSPGDETDEKLPFYAELGTPEVWIIDRDSKRPQLHRLTAGRYHEQPPAPAGWLHGEATGLRMRHAPPNRIAIRLAEDPATERTLPED